MFHFHDVSYTSGVVGRIVEVNGFVLRRKPSPLDDVLGDEYDEHEEDEAAEDDADDLAGVESATWSREHLRMNERTVQYHIAINAQRVK